ncbi:MAG: fimbrillin family protein [Rikenellaceae bacterium]|nr:fimbrillin family protein [Rikenellaceae bacterium]
MKIKILKHILPAAVCFAAVAGCTSDKTPSAGDGDHTAIRLKGMSTRVGTLNDPDLFLVGFNGGDTTQRYFEPVQIYTANELNDTSPEDFTFSSGTMYYPLGQREIDLFTYTGSLEDYHLMKLAAGTEDDNDYILSNYGKRSSDNDVNPVYQQTGTPGSSEDPAELLQFRHVMTQLNVEVVVDEDQTNPVDPEPVFVEFTIDGVNEYGRYSIRSKSPDSSLDAGESVRIASNYGTDSYKVQLGTNYLIPNGLNLVGETFTSLKIDDYTATAADLAEFIIKSSDNEPDMFLYPGYAYTMTLIIQKLRLVGVRITRVNWVEISLNVNNPTYDPHRLQLGITGGYDNSDDDKITKLVLHTTSGIQYVGDAADAADVVNFVTVLQDALESVDVYTGNGLLLTLPSSQITYDPAAPSLAFELSEVGMLLETPGSSNSETNRYMITTTAQFMNINKNLYGHYLQTDDIELEEPGVYTTDFDGFGDFHGSYWGNGYWIGRANFTGKGLFASNHGDLVNIRIYTGNMDLSAGTTYAGAICAENYGLIYACINEATLFDAPATVGGICGLNGSGGRVIACLNTGDIRSGTVQGGICGENTNVAETVFAACLSTGHLNVSGGNTVGGIIGTSTNYTGNSFNIISNCFWLEGSAQSAPGGAEGAVGQGTVTMDEVSDLDPVKMRNGIDINETDADRVVNKLNAEIDTDTSLPSTYHYVLDEIITGITWPMPYDASLIP